MKIKKLYESENAFVILFDDGISIGLPKDESSAEEIRRNCVKIMTQEIEIHSVSVELHRLIFRSTSSPSSPSLTLLLSPGPRGIEKLKSQFNSLFKRSEDVR